MGQFCDPEFLTGALESHFTKQGKDTRLDSAYELDYLTTKEPTVSRLLTGYEEHGRAQLYNTGDAKSQNVVPYDMMDPKIAAKAIFQKSTWASASDAFGDTFYNAVSAPIRKVQNAISKAEREAIVAGKPAESALKQYTKEALPVITKIETDIQQAILTQQFKGIQAKYGLSQKNANEALHYLHHLKEAPWLKGRGLVGQVLNNTAKFSAMWNLRWAMFNAGDLWRITAQYADRPKALVQGWKDAVFDRNFEGQDIYHGIKAEDASLFDPFSATNLIQQRLAYFMDKAAGGDGLTGARKHAFIRDAWDLTGIEYRSKLGPDGSSAMMGLGRFLLAETYWHADNYMNMLKVVAGKGDLKQLQRFAVYNVGKVALFGGPSIVPAMVWPTLRSYMKDEDIKDAENFGLVNWLFTEALQMVAPDSRFTVATELQPMSVLFGARGQQLSQLIQTPPKALAQGVSDLTKGELVGAMLNGGVFYLAAAGVLGGIPKVGGIVKTHDEAAKTFIGGENMYNAINNGTTMKILKTWADSVENHWDVERFKRETGKAALGASTIKKD